MVERKVGTVDYVVITPDRRKGRWLCYINMLKECYEENGENVESCAVVVTSDRKEAEVESDCLSDSKVRLNNSAVLASLKNKLSHLSANEVSELEHLIMDNTLLSPDTPTRTSVLCHDVDVGDANPVKQHAYRVNP